MPLVEVETTIKVDGTPLQPFVRRINPSEAVSRKALLPPNSAIFVILTTLQIVNGFVIQTDNPVDVSVNNSTYPPTNFIHLNAGGMLLMLDGNVNAGANFNILIRNPSSTLTCTLTTLEMGP
jgi:hypothetical protein